MEVFIRNLKRLRIKFIIGYWHDWVSESAPLDRLDMSTYLFTNNSVIRLDFIIPFLSRFEDGFFSQL